MTATTAEGLEGGVVNKNTTTISTTHTALLPKESEQTERKRPLAIQELLEKKRARLAHYSGMTTLTTTNGEEENRKSEHGKTAKTMKKERNEVEFLHLGDPELADLFSHICNGEGDSETTSSNSTDTAKKHGNSSSKCHSFGRLLRRATEKSSAREHLNLSPASDSSLAFALQQQQTELEYMAVTEEERQQQQKAPKASKAGSSCADVNESPLSKSVPHNKVFAQVPGRLSLLSNVIKYKMSVGEVKRRLMGPEAFNFSLLGALLRRAKMPEKSQMLVDELSQVGLSIPRGRRRLSQITLLSALTEAESIQFANDFKKITEAEFPAHQLAVETLQRQKDNMDLKNRLDKLKAAFKVTQEFQEIIEKDRSPVMDNKMDPILSEEVQNSLSTFSMLTHGFGNPAIQVGISCFVRMLQHQIQIIEDRLLL